MPDTQHPTPNTRSFPPLRLAVIGCGAIGARHADAILASAGATLVAACDTDPERAAAVARRAGGRAYADTAALLAAEALDAVTIATPDHLHVEPVLRALEAGCHVFCEKPLATTLEEAVRMRDAAAAAGRHLAVDYNRRFGFAYQKARELIHAGRIGPITHALIRVTDYIPDSARGRGPYVMLYMLLSHHIDLLRCFCGEVRSVHMTAPAPGADGLIGQVALRFRFAGSEAVGALVGAYREGQMRTHERAELGGPLGGIEVEDVQLCVRWHGIDPDAVEERRPNYFRGESVAFYDTLTAHIHAFLQCLREGTAPPVTAEDGVRGLRIIAAAIESHRTGQPVEV